MRESPGPGYWVSAYQNLSISYNGSQILEIKTQSSVIFVSEFSLSVVYRDDKGIISL